MPYKAFFRIIFVLCLISQNNCTEDPINNSTDNPPSSTEFICPKGIEVDCNSGIIGSWYWLNSPSITFEADYLMPEIIFKSEKTSFGRNFDTASKN